jgi:hypothetical protein
MIIISFYSRMEGGLFSKGSSGHSIRTVGTSHRGKSVGSSYSGYIRGIALTNLLQYPEYEEIKCNKIAVYDKQYAAYDKNYAEQYAKCGNMLNMQLVFCDIL